MSKEWILSILLKRLSKTKPPFDILQLIRSHLKNRILVQDRGGPEFQTAGILLYVEDLKRGTNPAEKGGRPKDIFEMTSILRFSSSLFNL